VLELEAASYRHAGATRDSLQDVSLALDVGSICGLVGVAESGKTTLCLALAGLAPRVIGGRLRGRLLLDGEDATDWPMHRLAGVVVVGLQDPAGQLSMVADTIYEEVAFGPANLGLPADAIHERVEDALDRLAIGDLAARDPRQLSGGQQQLVVVAGLLAMRPRYLVLDEPLAHLDAGARERVLQALRALAVEGSGILLAEQRTGALAEICDTIVALDDGRIVARGPGKAVLASAEVVALGIEEPEAWRLERLVREAGLDPGASEGVR